MNKKDIALCLGERIGESVSPNQIRLKGDWLFYKAPYLENEVDCYFAKHAKEKAKTETYQHI